MRSDDGETAPDEDPAEDPSTPTVPPPIDQDATPTLTPSPDLSRRPGEKPPEPLLTGKELGGCTIHERVGQGGMGTAYRALHHALDKEVVVKVLPPAYSASEELRERFIREARATAKLAHGNVVQVYNVGEEDGVLFYVMEFVPGQSLQELSDEMGALPPAEATRYLIDTARGLGAAHELGIIHRDVKPGNILITPRGVAKVVDFGLARDVTKEGLSESGQTLGTPHYMAPEQVDGRATAQSDLYSLGITYFRLLTGKLPFVGSSAYNVMHKHMSEPPPSPRKHVPALPDSVCTLIEILLRKDPADRLDSADEVARVLQAILRELEGEGPPVVLQSGARARSEATGSALLVVGVLLGIAAVSALALVLAPGEAPEASALVPPPTEGPPTGARDPGPTDAGTPTDGDTPSLPPGPPLAPDVVLDSAPIASALPVRVEGHLQGEAPAEMEVHIGGKPAVREGERFAVELEDLEEGTNALPVALSWRGEVLAEHTWQVRLDTLAPKVQILDPAPEAVVAAEDLPDPRTITVKVRVPAEEEGALVTVRLLHGDAQAVACAASGEEHRAELPLGAWVGRLTLEVTARDAAGNSTSVEREVVVRPRGMVMVGPAAGLPAIFMDRDEVTRARFQAFIESTGRAPDQWEVHNGGPGDLPARFVSYEEAQAFAHWAGRRLPTEREWQIAAGWRDGRQQDYSWGDHPPAPLHELRANLEACRGRGATLQPVGSMKDDLSQWGCRDMVGNVAEWATLEPPDAQGRQVYKGGDHGTYRLAAAKVTLPGQPLHFRARRKQIGFRCARDLSPGEEVRE